MEPSSIMKASPQGGVSQVRWTLDYLPSVSQAVVFSRVVPFLWGREQPKAVAKA